MNQLKIKTLSLRNFKGIAEFDVNFNDGITEIFGTNRAGKTTVVDAFHWLLFDKDSTGKSDFEVKTVQPNGEPMHELYHAVKAVIVPGTGEEVTVEKILREKWVKRRGDVERTFSGHTKDYFWNAVPMQEGEFNQKVSELIPSETFKLVSNPEYFPGLDWKKRRAILIELSGEASMESILSGISDKSVRSIAASVLDEIKKHNKSIEDYRKQLSFQRNELKKKLEQIPTRIDEVKNGMPQPQDWKQIESAIANLKTELDGVEKQLTDVVESDRQKEGFRRKLNADLAELNQKLDNIVFAIKKEVEAKERESGTRLREKQAEYDSCSRDLQRYRNDLQLIIKDIQRTESDIETMKSRRDELREIWQQENSRKFEFKPNELQCDKCGEELNPISRNAKLEELEKDFNEKKSTRLQEINQDGVNAKNRQQQAEKELAGMNQRNQETESVIAKLESSLSVISQEVDYLKAAQQNRQSLESLIHAGIDGSTEHREVSTLIESKNNEIEEFNAIPDDRESEKQELQDKKTKLIAGIDELKKILHNRDQIERDQKRIEELQKEEQETAQLKADIENREFSIEAYVMAQMDVVSQKVNSMFNIVEFRMFRKQINGGTEDCCDILVNGIEYHKNLNAEGRINAGIDIINTLSKFYGYTAPVFVDNAERVVEIMPVESQMIKLIVSAQDERLRVN